LNFEKKLVKLRIETYLSSENAKENALKSALKMLFLQDFNKFSIFYLFNNAVEPIMYN
jgi:hypothetical protein